MPVNPKRGLTFANGLRAIVRQDPDIIMVGEIRDRETADIAIRSALTGHLVFSTLHTNSAAESLARLDDMGVEMFLIAGALKAVMAQRLLRRVCPQCKTEAQADTLRLADLGVTPERIAGGTYFVGNGCNHCMNSGYKGRVAVYEVLFVDARIRGLIRRRSDVEEVLQAARDAGMKSLLEAGLEMVLAGKTTLEEVDRCIGTA